MEMFVEFVGRLFAVNVIERVMKTLSQIAILKPLGSCGEFGQRDTDIGPFLRTRGLRMRGLTVQGLWNHLLLLECHPLQYQLECFESQCRDANEKQHRDDILDRMAGEIAMDKLARDQSAPDRCVEGKRSQTTPQQWMAEHTLRQAAGTLHETIPFLDRAPRSTERGPWVVASRYSAALRIGLITTDYESNQPETGPSSASSRKVWAIVRIGKVCQSCRQRLPILVYVPGRCESTLAKRRATESTDGVGIFRDEEAKSRLAVASRNKLPGGTQSGECSEFGVRRTVSFGIRLWY